LNFRVLDDPGGSDGLPGGHPDLNSGHPGLLEHFGRRVTVVKVFAAPFRPQEVENEGAENVEGLPVVGEAADVISVEAQSLLSVVSTK
jgi:hypothetical protein